MTWQGFYFPRENASVIIFHNLLAQLNFKVRELYSFYWPRMRRMHIHSRHNGISPKTRSLFWKRWLYIINLILVYLVCGGILRLHFWIGLNLQHPRRIYKAAIAGGIMTIRRRLRFRREDKKLCHQGPVPYAHEVHTFRDHSQKLRRKINRNRKK